MEPVVGFCSFSQFAQSLVRLGDYLYLPPQPPESVWDAAHTELLGRLDRVPPDVAQSLRGMSASMCRLVIQHNAIHAADAGLAVPAWMQDVPEPYRIEALRAWAERSIDDPMIVSSFPSTGLGGYVVDLDPNTLIGGAFTAFSLFRLSNIRQLAWLTIPVLDEDRREADYYPMRHEHTRLVHVLDVAALVTVLAAKLELSSREANTLILAAITHDARTPAGGDTTKLLDRDFFDEDRHYAELLDGEGIPELLERFDVPRELLVETVHGKGILGRLLDVADKTAYLSRDAAIFHQRVRGGYAECVEGYAVHDLLRAHPKDAFSAWKSVRIIGEHVVFEDHEALARMLTIRALLFRALYWHPSSRFTEFIVGHVVLRHLIETGVLRKEDLLVWRDEDLDRQIQAYACFGNPTDFGQPHHEGFDDAAALERRCAELSLQEDIVLMTELLPERVSSGTAFRVPCGLGTAPFKEVYPELARPIDELAKTVQRFRLYWVSKRTASDRLRDALHVFAFPMLS